MNFLIVGLGNPGKEYELTRHNTGWLALDAIIKDEDWDEDKKLGAFVLPMKFDKHEVTLIKPATFMNNSGGPVKKASDKYKVKPENVIVIHDELDIGLGDKKLSFNRGPGGHRGLISIVKHLKTEKFVRIRIGISPKTPSGKIKKPKGEKAVIACILGKFKPKEMEVLKKVFKEMEEIVDTIVTEGREVAMNRYN